MNLTEFLRKDLLTLFLLLSFYFVQAQVDIKGTVYDRSQLYPLRGVTVMGVSGMGTSTDSLGHYSIRLPTGDSIYFSYLGKSTSRIPIADIGYTQEFDMSLEVAVDSLPSVFVWPRDYHFDSLVNRREYQRVFDYQGAAYLDEMKANKGKDMGFGFDLDLFLSPKANRRMEAFQKRLEEEEQDIYVDHRFSRALVKRITDLDAPAIDTFMRWYRPSYDFVKSFETDWDFYQYIQRSAKAFSDIWKQDHPNPSPTETPK
jgi:hypothetical protein